MSEDAAPVGVCLACLRVRADVEEGWLAEASAGKERTTYFADDDFAFPARKSVTSSTVCPRCRRSAEVIAVDRDLAARIEGFAVSRERETDG